MSWHERVEQRNEQIRSNGRWRTVRTLDGGAPRTTVTGTGEKVIAFASNDYLGLSRHPEVVAAARAALDEVGAGAGAARLIVGGRPVHDELEAGLARHHRRERALLFPTGYQANVGVLTALAATAPDCVVLSDELNHASIIDGARLARAEVHVYRHAQVDHLEQLLEEHAGRPVVVVTDSVFSMDGDLAPLDEIALRCAAHDAILVVDEAHAVLSAPPPADAVVVGTLSKTLGALGGFVAADGAVIDLLRNTARSFIFTTAGTPADAAAALAALGVLRGPDGAAALERLRSNIDVLAPGHPSPIVPVMLGSEERATDVAARLLERGYLVPAIRPPTVPVGTCRLRVAVSADHDAADLVALGRALDELGVDR